MLYVHNTMTGSKDRFEPLVPGKARMYVCGVTVYDYCHIGHARSALIFDVLRRHLEYSGLVVEFAKNFTDVDDKIIRRANEQGVSCESITTTYINAYYEDMEKLGVRRATIEPRATEHITDIVTLVERLLTKGMAYLVDGDVYFQVDRYPLYGSLSKRKLDDLQAGARVDVDQRKRHPMDFALWKSSKPDEPSWDSPWGPGRPGWHIECSAMAMRHLGETFDIHGGGMDLIFPHHENEIAQSCGATGKEFARYWIHNGFVQINQEKMSKSLGNFFTIREIFKKSEWPDAVTGEVLRYFLLSTHYRSPVDFSDHSLREAKGALNGFYDLFERLKEPALSQGVLDQQMYETTTRMRQAFAQAMDDDLNTSEAVAALQRLRGETNKALEAGLSDEMRRTVRQGFRTLGAVLGLLQLDCWQFKPQLQPASSDMHGETSTTLTDDDVADKIAARIKAKKVKNYRLADQLRAELASHGVTIEDRPDGTSRWKR
ncbi:MAG: cysteine--tRNA ligase [Nitrospira sp.]|nr:cysteine--tRNA ligase [Nitrospira sp.]MBA3753460.1 cysteine--tRNA ligase [Nitrospira sp.]